MAVSLEVRTQHFIAKATTVHNGKYDYTQVAYIASDTPVRIICPTHGIFEQTPATHARGSGCQKCANEAKAAAAIGRPGTTVPQPVEKFIAKAVAVHGDRYDYSLVDYQRFDVPVQIICPEHGVFDQQPVNHARGKGCTDCGHQRRVTPMRNTTERFIEKARAVHGDRFDYSRAEYRSQDDRVEIGCSVHGIFEQTPDKHLSGKGCRKCADERNGELQRRTTSQFVEAARRVHGDTYDYSRAKYTRVTDPITIVCRVHGEFELTPHKHVSRGDGCARCSNGISEKSQVWLDSLGVALREFRIPGTRFRADGYDPDTNTVYEYLGCFWHGCARLLRRRGRQPAHQNDLRVVAGCDGSTAQGDQ